MKMLLRCLLIVLPLSYCVLSGTPPAATTPTTTSYNCSHNYTLRIGNSSVSSSRPQLSSSTTTGTCTEENTSNTAGCVLSSQDGYRQCRSLSEILSLFNGQVGSGDCLYLELEQGEYALSSLSTISVNYSLVMVAVDSGRVIISCSGLAQPNRVNSSCASDPTVPLMFGKERGEVSVLLDGVWFQDCPRPLQFDNLDRVTIINCLFSNFEASALDLFNIGLLEIHQSNFTNCKTDIAKTQYRGNSGAVSIAYYTPNDTTPSTSPITSQPLINITGCSFWNNSAFLPQQNSSEQINLALNNNYFFGRGGGLGIFIQESVKNVITFIRNCTFVKNYAASFGGGAYLYINGKRTQHNFSVEDCNFTRNSGGEGSFGGGIQVPLLIQNLGRPPCNLEFIRCVFDMNVADYGGGLSTVQVYSQGAGNLVTVKDCNFTNNRANEVGSGLMFGSFLYVQNRNESYVYTVSNCVFSDNEAPGGTLGAGFINVQFHDDNVFFHNTGPALRVVGSQIQVYDHMSFVGNNADGHEGGALHIQAFGQIKVYPGSDIEFINNTGRIGAAIVVDVQRSSRVHSELIYNPNCFLIHSNSTLPPSDWDDVSIRFIGNHARVGPAVFISHLYHCSWFSVEKGNNSTNRITAYFSIQNFTKWQIFNYSSGDNFASTHSHESASENFYFQTQPVNVTSHNNTSPLTIWPGQEEKLNLEGIDQFGNPTYVIVRLSDQRSGINFGAFSQAGDNQEINTTESNIVNFDPALLPIQPSDEVVKVSYGLRSFDLDSYEPGYVINVTLDTPYNVRDADVFNLKLKLSSCLYGYELRSGDVGNDLVVCQCVNSEFYVLNCEQEVIVLRDGLWAGREDEPLPHLDLSPCPIPYCRCHTRDGSVCENLFFQNDPKRDLQCHPTRQGTLCGQCINGTSVGVLRTNCRDCDRENYFALFFLIVGDILAVGLILVAAMQFQLSFPHSFKGLLFYVQTSYYTTEYFPISFWDIRQYMLYMSSTSGLYFPWDFCLYPGMTALVSFSPRFIPAVIATVMGTIAVIGAYYRRARDGRKYVWHGIWSLILLLYAPLVFTCTSLLHCPETPSVRGEEEADHWFLEGEVICFRDPGHIVLGLIAIFVLFLLVLLVPVVFIFTIVGTSPKLRTTTRTIGWMHGALMAGYRDSYETRWWVSWELLRRLLLIGLTVALPGRTLVPVLFIGLVLALHIFARPYEKLRHNIIEAVILINYILLFLLRGTQAFLDNLSNYTGNQVPENRGDSLAALDNVTWLFFPFFYAPLVLGALSAIVMLIFHFIKWVRRKKYGVGDKEQNRERGHSRNGVFLDYDYSLGGRSSNSSATSTDVTFTEVDLEYSKSNITVETDH